LLRLIYGRFFNYFKVLAIFPQLSAATQGVIFLC
jgi:hypothetical protein